MDFEAIRDWYVPLRYVVPAYAIAILLIGGYVRSISSRRNALEREQASFLDEDDRFASSSSSEPR